MKLWLALGAGTLAAALLAGCGGSEEGRLSLLSSPA